MSVPTDATTPTMQAAVLTRFGDADSFQCVPLPRPQPEGDELLIRVAYAGVNPADWKDRRGYLAAFFDIEFPYVIGFDAAGWVEWAPPGSSFQVGDRVVTPSAHGQGKWGSYAQYLVVSPDGVARVPDSLDLRVAATVPVSALTAWQAITRTDRGYLQPGQSVMVHGGAGSVGRFAIQFAKELGADVTASCSAANRSALENLGAHRTVDYRVDLPEQLARSHPAGVDLLIDAVGASSLPDIAALVKPGGRVVSIATLNDDGDVPALIADAAGAGIARQVVAMDDVDCAADLATIVDAVADGRLQLPAIHEYALADVAAAHRLLENGRAAGKLVLRVSDSASGAAPD